MRIFWFAVGAFFSVIISYMSKAKYYSHVPLDTPNLVTKPDVRLSRKDLDIYDKAQKKAMKSFQNKLLLPTENAELYYNSNEGGELLGSNGLVGNKTHPPHPPPPEGCEATIMLFRHCEAGPAREHCGYMGYQRSKYFASLFGIGARYPAPSYIFALAAGERHKPFVRNWREIETVQPLADKLNITVNTSYGFPEKRLLAEHLYALLRTGDMCGKVAILSWKHHDIPDFTHEMGCGPSQGCPLTFAEDDYDSIWQVKYVYHKELHAPYALGDIKREDEEKRLPWGIHPKWFAYGIVTHEIFDPLAFSFQMGAYKE